MPIQIIRKDPMLGIGVHEPPAKPMTVEVFPDWPEAFSYLRGLNIPLTPAHEAEFQSHPDTQFSWREVINTGATVYVADIQYDVRVVE